MSCIHLGHCIIYLVYTLKLLFGRLVWTVDRPQPSHRFIIYHLAKRRLFVIAIVTTSSLQINLASQTSSYLFS
jgi:hypothetical protein